MVAVIAGPLDEDDVRFTRRIRRDEDEDGRRPCAGLRLG
jgi:hypothetical protein